jgi:hypothetical protein
MKGRKNGDYFVFLREFGEYFVVVNLVSKMPFFTGWFCIPLVNLPSLRPSVTEIRIIATHKEMVIVYNLKKEADKFMTIGQ